MINYQPSDLLKKIAPAKKIAKLVTGRLTLNKAALSFVSDIDFLSKKTIEQVALNVIANYKDKFENAKDEGLSASDAKEEALNDKKLLVNRVQNSVVNQVAVQIKDQYSGEFYIWTPSSANIPDPLHSLNYGKKFQIGVGEMPGDRMGCQCGMKILVTQTQLDL